MLKRREAKLGRQHPDTQKTVANLGINYNDAGRLDEAIPLLEEAYQASGRIPKLRRVGARLLDAYTMAGRSADAAKLVEQLLADARQTAQPNSPQLAGTLAQFGRTLLQAGAYAEAEPLLRECLAIYEKTQPDLSSTFDSKALLGGALLAQKKYDEAIAAFEEVIRHQPDSTEAHFLLAAALAQAKQWDRSASVYAAALKRFGIQLWPGPRYEAIRSDEVFRRLTAQQPDDRLPWLVRARLHVFERDWKRAAADYARVYDRLASIDPANLLPEADDLFGYGCVLVLLGDRHGYEQLCNNWADRAGDSPAWAYSLGARLGGQPPPGCPCPTDRRTGREVPAGWPHSLEPPRPEPRPLPERRIRTRDRARVLVERRVLARQRKSSQLARPGDGPFPTGSCPRRASPYNKPSNSPAERAPVNSREWNGPTWHRLTSSNANSFAAKPRN